MTDQLVLILFGSVRLMELFGLFLLFGVMNKLVLVFLLLMELLGDFWLLFGL